MKGKLPLIIFLLAQSILLNAQDTLYFKTGETRTVKVKEVGLDEIKYQPWGILEAPIITVERRDLQKLILENGDIINFSPDPLSVDNVSPEILQKKNVVKLDFLSPLTNDLVFGWERMIKPGMNLETAIGIIGIGVSEQEGNPSGVFIKAGLKMRPGQEMVVRGSKYSHYLTGRYIKPEIIFNQYSLTIEDFSGGGNGVYQRSDYTNLALNIVFGNQKLLANTITIGYYIGLGYGFQWVSPENSSIDEENFESYSYSHVYLGESFPLVISAGLTLGYLF